MHERAALLLDRIDLQRGGRVLARGLSLRLAPGEHGRVSGGNGTGKTSLALAACGLLPVAGGRIERPRRVGYVPQEPDFPRELVCAAYLEQLAALGGARRDAALGQAREALARFQLADAAGTRIGALSRGWRQRLNLARGWLGAPELLVLDEPQTALDPEGMDALRAALAGADTPAVLLVAPPGVGCDDLAPEVLDLSEDAR